LGYRKDQLMQALQSGWPLLVKPEYSKYADWRQVAVSYYLLQDKKQRAEQECMHLLLCFGV
jgi:hypothetical protein